ncbi:MAG: hypothetical protein KAS32_05335 [Candidatus Peribacteraceae bacterium]|nr:hypothetical protein [Candidatus Peribacteraceae bacterium]
MEKIVPALYASYGNYVIKAKMIPNIIDGLLPVQKRILLTAHTIARTSFVKTAKILGENMARWHPHAEALGTVMWCVHNGFMIGDGQWGSKTGTEEIGCAAPRYTNVKASPLIEELAFKLVKHVEWVEEELDLEPKVLPTMLPFCLMPKYEVSSIAFGFRTDIPNYHPKDLIKRLQYLLGKRKKITIKPNISGCTILSDNKTCEKLLKTGKGTIELHGNFDVDKKNKCVYIYGWNPRIKFETLFGRIDKYNKWGLISNGDIGYIDETEESKTKIKFEVAKQRNTEIIFDKLVEAITESMKVSLNYNIIAVDNDGELQFPSVDTMLIGTYKHYKEILEKSFKASITDINTKISELNIIESIRPHIGESKVLKEKDVDKVCKILQKLTGVNQDAIKDVISKYMIRKLLTVSTDTAELKAELKELKKAVDNIDAVCNSKYKEMEVNL